MQYTEKDLERLHSVLYEILEEIHRICIKYDIPYFLIGGSAIGLYYDKGILPWDDDLDIGMTRENYNKFISIAQKELKPEYFLSCVETDVHTPFFYSKIKMNGTLFIEEWYKDVPMHQGIFVDIFPYDRVPDNKILRNMQYKIANFLKCCMMSKEVWLWSSFGHCQIREPLPRSKFSSLINCLINKLFSKQFIYRLNIFVQTLFNKSKTEYYNLVVAKINYVESCDITDVVPVEFGPIKTFVLKEWVKICIIITQLFIAIRKTSSVTMHR
jgi:lipopolysaccharide cholinephosphotransferase